MTVAAPLIAAFWGGLTGLLGLFLAFQVVRVRQRTKIALGDGGNPDLQRAIRVFGNWAEYAPICLALVALLDLAGAPRLLVHGCGAALFVGRALHAQGLSGVPGLSFGRSVGMILTWASLLVASAAAVWIALSRGVFG